MTRNIRDMFADATAKLDDLHAIAVEGQRADNAPDMQNVLTLHIRSGLVALDATMRDITTALDGCGR
jgi:hypothetical protein